MTSYIVLDISTQICGKLHPTLLILSAYGSILRVQSIFQLNAGLHTSHRTVATMFQNIRQLLQQLRLQTTNRHSTQIAFLLTCN